MPSPELNDQSAASRSIQTGEVNPYWKAVIATAFLFCGTALAIVMTEFGERQSPANQFLRKHGATLAALEVGAVLVSCVLAMRLDQQQSRSVTPVGTPPESSSEEATDVGQDLRVE
ncbi:MAG: hypothetical protein DWH91_16870 [Planctomycetota bacterium]|nr:MAG: hypothetical protein DWH91_16870 [Planctomycetota bacterium]